MDLGRILEMVKRGVIPDLRNLTKCVWSYYLLKLESLWVDMDKGQRYLSLLLDSIYVCGDYLKFKGKCYIGITICCVIYLDGPKSLIQLPLGLLGGCWMESMWCWDSEYDAGLVHHEILRLWVLLLAVLTTLQQQVGIEFKDGKEGLLGQGI